MPLTFGQFLREKLFRGVAGSWNGYYELYVNPTRDECSELMNLSPTDGIGAILSGNDVYAWNRGRAAHQEVKHLIPNDPNFLPLYLWYSPNKLRVELSIWTMNQEKRKGYNTDEGIAAITERITTNPNLKQLGVIEVDPW